MTYLHSCSHCQQEFEEEYSIKADPPTKCSLCGEEGGVTRLINCETRGRVELEGYELKAHVESEAKKLNQEAARNENLLGNLVGESRYHQNELGRDIIRREIGRNSPFRRSR